MNPHFEKRLEVRQEKIPGSEPHPLHPLAYATMHKGYWGSVLEGEDAGFTGVLLEPRAPMLDLRVLRFELRLPPVPWSMDKYLTRKAMGGYLPEQVLVRAKTPLLRDPQNSFLEERNWRPDWSFVFPRTMEKYVSAAKWRETLQRTQGSICPGDLRPLFLAYWLKGIENTELIE
jgi:asparagine synthase (glutamine-hydrolysing)